GFRPRQLFSKYYPLTTSISAGRTSEPVPPASIQPDHMTLRSEHVPSTLPNVPHEPHEPKAKPRYKWQTGTNQYTIRQAAYLPVEGVGVNGTYFIKGSLALNEGRLFISAMGFTAASRVGRAHFNATV